MVCRNEWKNVADIVYEFAPDCPSVLCYAGDVKQALLNIMTNAAHAIASDRNPEDPKGVIRIATQWQPPDVVIAISDTGSGIPDEIRDVIFDPFFSTRDVGGGKGQGLAIAHFSIVQRHGGTLTVESEPGKGTTFRIRLPVEDNECSTGQRPGRSNDQRGPGDERLRNDDV